MKKIKFFLLSILSLFSTFKVNAMNPAEKNKLKALAFDSFEAEENFDTNEYDPDSFDDDNFTGKKRPMRLPKSMFKPSTGYFTIQITNTIGAAQQVELFNSLRSISKTTNTQLFSGFVPFTAVNRAAVNLNNVVYFAANGDLIIEVGAATKITISCKQIPYRVLLDSLQFYALQIKETKFSYTNDPQLDNDIVHFESTILGLEKRNPITPRTYFSDFQQQSKQVTITQGFIIDGEKGLTFLVNSGETISLNFKLSGLNKLNASN